MKKALVRNLQVALNRCLVGCEEILLILISAQFHCSNKDLHLACFVLIQMQWQYKNLQSLLFCR